MEDISPATECGKLSAKELFFLSKYYIFEVDLCFSKILTNNL